MSHSTTIGLAAGLVHAGPVVARLKSDLFTIKTSIRTLGKDAKTGRYITKPETNNHQYCSGTCSGGMA